MAISRKRKSAARARCVPARGAGLRGTVSTAIRSRELSHLVADALRDRIAKGELNAGDQLPPEAELLLHFQVSRPTLREALRVVESEGLIRLGRGARGGATVLGPSIETAARYGAMYLAAERTTIAEVHEVRMLHEPSLVGLLARRSRRGNIVKALHQCVLAQQKSLRAQDFVGVITALNDFHRELVEFTDNRALSLLAGILGGIPARVYAHFLATGSASGQRALRQRSEQSVAAHDRLVNLIDAGDGDRAESFWRSYMQETASFLVSTGMAPLRVDAANPPY